ncbi:hypothetical protein [Mesorhizobium sp. M0491]|uniref:hypothetical protein n=1 Tax=Mesorhizobium sp. M0491 TaxID=2956950 RepID=UPI00333C28D6
MKIFASWSGKQSHSIAEALKDWLPNVLQAVDVFVSSQDISSGDRGLNTIAENLAERGFGIVILTKTNLKAPWVLFEAGALSNTMPGRVTPLLCDLPDLALVESPLSQFQYNKFDRTGILKLVKDINKASSAPIEDARITSTFEKWWPDLESAYQAIPADKLEEEKAKNIGDEKRDTQAALAQLLTQQNYLRRSQNDIMGLLAGVLETLGISRASTDNETTGRFTIGTKMAPEARAMLLAQDDAARHAEMLADRYSNPEGDSPPSPADAVRRRAKF